MNKAILIGRLTRDPEVRYTQSGEPVTTFTIAIDRRSANAQGQREADFIPIVTFKKTAELCGKYLSKGRLAGVSGRIQTRNYTAQDGTKRYVTEVVCDEVQFLERPPEGAMPRDLPANTPAGNIGAGQSSGQTRGNQGAQSGYDTSGYYPDVDPGNAMPMSTVMDDDDDLPF